MTDRVDRVALVVLWLLVVCGGIVYPVVCRPLGWCAVTAQEPQR